MIEDKQEFKGPVDRDASLVRFVAKQVMGWTETQNVWLLPGKGQYFRVNPVTGAVQKVTHETGDRLAYETFNPLTNDHHASQIVDRMAAKWFSIYIDHVPHLSNKYNAHFLKEDRVGYAEIEVQGNPPTDDDFKAARLRSWCEAAAKAHGWDG